MNQNLLPTPQPPTRDLAALEDEITELAAHLNAATYRLLALIREFDERHGWSGAGLKSCAHWLNWKCGIALGAAREKVRVAHALDALPQISAALRGGRVSFSKVRHDPGRHATERGLPAADRRPRHGLPRRAPGAHRRPLPHQ